MFINLKDQGVKRLVRPQADIVRVREYHPEVLEYYDRAKEEYKKYTKIMSGYRDKKVKGGAAYSPHFFGIALDIAVGEIQDQIKLGIICLKCGFTRLGLYPQKGIIHIDIAGADWMSKYKGTPFWSCINGKYRGYYKLEGAINACKNF